MHLLALSQIFLPFHILQRVNSLPFHIPEAWKRYPFRAEPPRIGHYREYPPPAPHGVVIRQVITGLVIRKMREDLEFPA